jgi:Arc/MetJ family transcription regulator
MRTTIDLDTQFLDEVVQQAGLRSRREAIEVGLRLLQEQAASDRLADAFGVSRGMAKAAPRRRF